MVGEERWICSEDRNVIHLEGSESVGFRGSRSFQTENRCQVESVLPDTLQQTQSSPEAKPPELTTPFRKRGRIGSGGALEGA